MPDGAGAPRYLRFPGARYYVASDTRGVGYEPRSGYVPLVNGDGTGTGAPALSAAEAWGDGGVFVFAGTGPASVAAFADAVRALVSQEPWTGSRVLWVTDPNLPPSEWRLAGLRLYAQTPTGGLLSALTTVPFRNYAVLADGDLPVRLDEAAAAPW